MEPLTTALLDLSEELKGVVAPLTVAGGFGLYLKQQYLEELREVDTLIDGELWPPARATEDIDLLLSAEIVVEPERMRGIRKALDALEFKSIVDFFQFEKRTEQGTIRVDLLSERIPDELVSRAKIDATRVRPKGEAGKVGLHAHPSVEAICSGEGAIRIPVSGSLSTGVSVVREIEVPGPFTMMLMKLHAFRDRMADADKGLGQHHALDLYRIVAMLTQEEFSSVARLIEEHSEEPVVREARRVSAERFGDADSMGIIGLQTYVRSRYSNQLMIDVESFVDAMRDLFS